MKKEKRSSKTLVLSLVSLFALLVVGLFISQAAPARSAITSVTPAAPALAKHVHPVTPVEEGSNVSDRIAFRLFFVAASVSERPTEDEIARQNSLLAPAQLDAKEKAAVVAALADFKKQYDSIIAAFNSAVNTATKSEELPDAAKMERDLDSLTFSTEVKIGSVVSEATNNRLYGFVQKEKKRMKVTEAQN